MSFQDVFSEKLLLLLGIDDNLVIASIMSQRENLVLTRRANFIEFVDLGQHRIFSSFHQSYTERLKKSQESQESRSNHSGQFSARSSTKADFEV